MPARSPPKNSTSAAGPGRRRRVPRAPARGLAAVGPCPVGDVVRRVAVREPVREDLVEDAVGEPARADRSRPRAGSRRDRSGLARCSPEPFSHQWPSGARRRGSGSRSSASQTDGDLPPATGRPGRHLGSSVKPARRRAWSAGRSGRSARRARPGRGAGPRRRSAAGPVAAAERDDVPDRAVVVEGGDQRDPVGQPFTAPDVRPPTMYFWVE